MAAFVFILGAAQTVIGMLLLIAWLGPSTNVQTALGGITLIAIWVAVGMFFAGSAAFHFDRPADPAAPGEV